MDSELSLLVEGRKAPSESLPEFVARTLKSLESEINGRLKGGKVITGIQWIKFDFIEEQDFGVLHFSATLKEAPWEE